MTDPVDLNRFREDVAVDSGAMPAPLLREVNAVLKAYRITREELGWWADSYLSGCWCEIEGLPKGQCEHCRITAAIAAADALVTPEENTDG